MVQKNPKNPSDPKDSPKVPKRFLCGIYTSKGVKHEKREARRVFQ